MTTFFCTSSDEAFMSRSVIRSDSNHNAVSILSFRYGNVKVGIVVVGESVVFARSHLYRHVERRRITRPRKHQVLEKMGEAGMIGIFVAGTHFIYYIGSGHTRGPVAMGKNHKTVTQHFTSVLYH